MIIENDLDNISHLSVKDFKEEDFDEETKSNFNLTNRDNSNNISLNLSSTKNNNQDNLVQIYFRNYLPTDKGFLIDKLQYFEKVSEIEALYEKKMRKSVKEFINLEKNPLNLVPKKNNSDLKKNLAKKLEKLNRKTEIAILEIIKENIKKQKNQIADKQMDNEDEIRKKVNSDTNPILAAANLQLNLDETEILREKEGLDEDEDNDGGDDISSNYDQGLNDF